MKIVYEYSHLGGSEILQVRFAAIQEEIRKIVESVKPSKVKIRRELSQE